jgi:hypothetical protein
MPAPRATAAVLSLLLAACARQGVAPAVPTVQVPLQPASPAQPSLTSLPVAAAGPRGASRQVGEHVEVEWHGSWWPAVIREVRGERLFVHYEGYGEEWDEVVTSERVRDKGAASSDEPDEPDDEPDP